MLVRKIYRPKDGTLLNGVGVHTVRWMSEWGIPTFGITDSPAAEALVCACRQLIAQYDASSDFVMGGALTNGPFIAIKEALDVLDREDAEDREASTE
jgi:hypothetical protein